MNPRIEVTTQKKAFLARADAPPVEWRIIGNFAPYETMVAEMEARVKAISAGAAGECVWLIEHPPLYTAGTSADSADLLHQDRFPVFRTGRGGQYTYHGPGQRVAYVMLDLKRRQCDVRLYVASLEQWLIDCMARFNVMAERRADRVGVWVRRPEKAPAIGGGIAEDKIAAIGIRLRKWVSFHGISLNVAPDLSHFDGIIPCGVSGHGVTSLEDLGLLVSMPEVDMALRASFEPIFGPTIDAAPIQTP
ncbi:MAG: lipoyl(octanoyl) transferase LipB [Rhizobiales bacterium]|nr:lipoyl(octanoyl) transferase LipB [Hyphomicrobiales bacterium]